MIVHAVARSARRRRLALAALLAPALFAGCAPRPTPIAKVGTEIISVDQFKDAARGNEARYPGVPDSAKSGLMDDLVRRSILVQEAKHRHLLADTLLQRMRTQEAQRLAMDRLIEVLVPKDAPVSDAEISAFHKRREVEAHLHLIFVLTKHDADAAKAAVEHGEDFAAVANRYNPAGMLPPGGDLGFLPPGALLEPLDQHLFDSPVNQLLGPDEIKGQGWAVSKIVERRPRKQEALEAQKPTLKAMIQQRKVRDLQQKAFQGLKDQYRVHTEEGGGQALFQRFNAGGDTSSQTRVLARFDGKGGKPGVYTMADALADMQDPAQQRPNFQNVPMIEHWLELQAVRRVSAIEAERRHLDQDPKVKSRVEERLNNALLERLYGEEVMNRVGAASPEDVKAAYERRASAFARLDGVKVRMITVPDSAAAATLMGKARDGSNPSLVTLQGMLPANLKAVAKVVERDVKYPTKDATWVQLQGAFMSLQPGDVRGPLKTPAGWAFFELVSKQQSTQPYDQLSPQIQHALEQEALETKRDLRLSAFTDSLRATTKVEIFRDRLKAIPWPVPLADGNS